MEGPGQEPGLAGPSSGWPYMLQSFIVLTQDRELRYSVLTTMPTLSPFCCDPIWFIRQIVSKQRDHYES